MTDHLHHVMNPDLLVLGSALLTGLLGGGHCAAMCGGIATGFGALAGRSSLRAAIEPNLGRIVGYVLAGAVAGGVGHGIVSVARLPQLTWGLRALVGAVLIVTALRLLGVTRGWSMLAGPERGLQRLLAPLRRRLLPIDSSAKRLLAGLLWGWLPCGLTGTLLTAAWLQATASAGALTLLAFGLGTLPLMLPLTWSGARLGLWLQRGPWRRAASLLVLLAGLATLAGPWLAQVPALHRTLGALGCASLSP